MLLMVLLSWSSIAFFLWRLHCLRKLAWQFKLALDESIEHRRICNQMNAGLYTDHGEGYAEGRLCGLETASLIWERYYK